jgi:hypothetical protein
VDAKLDQIRADAQVLETAAELLRGAYTAQGDYVVPNREEVRALLLTMAAGMRLAAGRMPDSREIPF